MKTYKLGTVDLHNPEKDCYCVLGVYLNEKYPEVLQKHYEEEEGEIVDAYHFMDDDCADDMQAMARIISPHRPPPRPGQKPFARVYCANDDGISKDILEEALSAAGVNVTLEDVRNRLTAAQMSGV